MGTVIGWGVQYSVGKERLWPATHDEHRTQWQRWRSGWRRWRMRTSRCGRRSRAAHHCRKRPAHQGAV